jgi:hypothetical protein
MEGVGGDMTLVAMLPVMAAVYRPVLKQILFMLCKIRKLVAGIPYNVK